jgi:hypothetical protein
MDMYLAEAVVPKGSIVPNVLNGLNGSNVSNPFSGGLVPGLTACDEFFGS